MSEEWRAPDPDPISRMVGEVQRGRRELGQRMNYLLRNAGLKVASGALHVLRKLVVEGELLVTGDTRIEGTLSLPAGIIDNEALANPVRYDSGFANSVDHPTITTSEQALATFSIPVPEGFTKALVICIAQLGVRNTSGSSSAAACRVYVHTDGPEWSARRFVSAAPNQEIFALATLFQAYNDLAVPQIDFEMVGIADHVWPNAIGGGTIEAFAIFTR